MANKYDEPYITGQMSPNYTGQLAAPLAAQASPVGTKAAPGMDWAWISRLLNDVSKTKKDSAVQHIRNYASNFNDPSVGDPTERRLAFENINNIYTSSKAGRGASGVDPLGLFDEFGIKYAGTKESQGYVSPYGTQDANGMIQTGQPQTNPGQTQQPTQSQYPAMANDYGLGSGQGMAQPQMGQQGMTPQPGGQPDPTQQPLTQQAGSESSRGFNPWSLIGESIARSR